METVTASGKNGGGVRKTVSSEEDLDLSGDGEETGQQIVLDEKEKEKETAEEKKEREAFFAKHAKELFGLYEQHADRETAALKQAEVARNSKSNAVREIFEKSGTRGPFTYRGDKLKIMIKKDRTTGEPRYYFRGRDTAETIDID
jgi:hypothetical protein